MLKEKQIHDIIKSKINEINGFFMFTNHHVIEQKFVDLKTYMSIYYGKSDNEIWKTIDINKEHLIK